MTRPLNKELTDGDRRPEDASPGQLRDHLLGARPEDYVTAREALVRAIGALSSSWNATLEQHWRSAVTSIIVTMLGGAAVHTAMAAERLAEPSSER